MIARRALTLALVATGIGGASAAGANAATFGGWSAHQQKVVVREGVMRTYAGHAFHGERRLTGDQLRTALGAIAERLGVDRVRYPPSGPVTMQTFNRIIVRQLGLRDVAEHVQRQARTSGLLPPPRFGTEVVARQLGLHYNHPYADDELEQFPTDPISRAEAAFSLSRIVGFRGWETQAVREQLLGFSLPRYSRNQRRVLRIAVSRIGWPYVWGGQSDTRYSDIGGWQPHGGFDCSGFVWRVFKLSGSPWGPEIDGRTAAQQASEIPRSRRLRLKDVRGGDLLFFGTASFTSTPTEANVTHEGIALTPEWMIQSSSQGVYLGSLTEKWRRDGFAWGRRVL